MRYYPILKLIFIIRLIILISNFLKKFFKKNWKKYILKGNFEIKLLYIQKI